MVEPAPPLRGSQPARSPPPLSRGGGTAGSPCGEASRGYRPHTSATVPRRKRALRPERACVDGRPVEKGSRAPFSGRSLHRPVCRSLSHLLSIARSPRLPHPPLHLFASDLVEPLRLRGKRRHLLASRTAGDRQAGEREEEDPRNKMGAPKLSRTRRPRIGREYPPNLSISLSGGKETNEDSPSNGERSGKSPRPNRRGVSPCNRGAASLQKRRSVE